MTLREKITFTNGEKVEYSINGRTWAEGFYVGAMKFLSARNYMDAKPHVVTDGYGSVQAVQFMRKIPKREQRWVNTYVDLKTGNVFTMVYDDMLKAERHEGVDKGARYLETHLVKYETE